MPISITESTMNGQSIRFVKQKTIEMNPLTARIQRRRVALPPSYSTIAYHCPRYRAAGTEASSRAFRTALARRLFEDQYSSRSTCCVCPESSSRSVCVPFLVSNAVLKHILRTPQGNKCQKRVLHYQVRFVACDATLGTTLRLCSVAQCAACEPVRLVHSLCTRFETIQARAQLSVEGRISFRGIGSAFQRFGAEPKDARGNRRLCWPENRHEKQLVLRERRIRNKLGSTSCSVVRICRVPDTSRARSQARMHRQCSRLGYERRSYRRRFGSTRARSHCPKSRCCLLAKSELLGIDTLTIELLTMLGSVPVPESDRLQSRCSWESTPLSRAT
jgi:hypothetical protein